MKNILRATTIIALSVFTASMLHAQAVEVWPGDVNNNGVVNNVDVIYLGAGYNQQGPVRDSLPDITWGPQAAPVWNGFISSFSAGPNLTYADCDGSGFINEEDLLAIEQNYGLTHGTPQLDSFLIGDSLDPPLFIASQPDSTFDSDTVELRIALGTPTNSISDFFGLAFSLTYDTVAVKPGSISASMGADIAGPGRSPLFLMQDDPSAGRVDFAISQRVNTGGMVNGGIDFSGEVLIVSLIIEDNLFGTAWAPTDLIVHFTDVMALDGQLQDIEVFASDASIPFKTTVSSARELRTRPLRIYPNPVQGALSIEGLSGSSTVSVVSLTGMLLQQVETDNANLKLETNELPAGMYLLHVQTATGSTIKKIMVNK